jgi:hypothetical protein
MSDGGRGRASRGAEVVKSSQKVERTAVRRSLHRLVRCLSYLLAHRLGPCVFGLIDAQLAAAWKRQFCEQAVTQILHGLAADFVLL